MRPPMVSLHLPCGVRLGFNPYLGHRPLLGLSKHPREVCLWLVWFSVAVTWYESTRRGQNMILVNNEELFAVFPR
jgi:hypothetical protein